MAIYEITQIQSDSGLDVYTFTGAAAATVLVDQTGWFDIPASAKEIIVVTPIVKAGTTDTATATLQGDLGDGNAVTIPAGTNTTNATVVATGTTAVTTNILVGACFTDGYKTLKPLRGRVSYTTNGSTDNKNVAASKIIVRK